jgi:hypothetical protein
MQKEAQKSQQNMAFNQFMLSNFERDPAAAAQFLKTPEGSKIGKKLFGENTDAFTGFLDLHSKAMQASQQQAQQAFGTKDPQTLEEWQDHANKLAKFESLHMNEPNFAQIKPQLDSEIKRAETQVQQLRQQQERQDALTERTSEHADTEADRAESRSERASEHAEHEQDIAETRKDRAAAAPKPEAPDVQHKRAVDLAAATDKLYQSNAGSAPSDFGGLASGRHLAWQTNRAKALIRAGADPALIGWTHGSSKSQGDGWVTESGEFIPDKTIGK